MSFESIVHFVIHRLQVQFGLKLRRAEFELEPTCTLYLCLHSKSHVHSENSLNSFLLLLLSFRLERLKGLKGLRQPPPPFDPNSLIYCPLLSYTDNQFGSRLSFHLTLHTIYTHNCVCITYGTLCTHSTIRTSTCPYALY